MKANDSVNLTVNKRDKQTAFSTIAKSAIEDSNLTDSALRLLIALLNNVKDWYISLNHYRKLWGWSKDKMTNATSCLIKYGYLIRNTIRDKKGTIIKWEYIINECPVPENQDMDEEQVYYSPVPENQDMDEEQVYYSPVPENQDMDECTINKESYPHPGLPDKAEPDKVEPDKVNQDYNKNNINNNNLNNTNLNEKKLDLVEVTDISTGENLGEPTQPPAKIENEFISFYKDEDFDLDEDECEVQPTPPTNQMFIPIEETEETEEIKKEKRYVSNIYCHVLNLINDAYDKETNNNIGFKDKLNISHKQYFNGEIDFAEWVKRTDMIQGILNHAIEIKFLIKTHSIDSSKAELIIKLKNAVLSMDGSITCLRFEREINRIKEMTKEKMKEYEKKWLSKNAEEIIKDPDAKQKF